MTQLQKRVAKLLSQGSVESVEQARQTLLAEVQSGNVEASLLLLDFASDYDPSLAPTALASLRVAAEQGSGPASYMLFRLYANSDHAPIQVLKQLVASGREESEKWLQLALKANYFEAQWEMAQRNFVSHNPAETLRLIEELKKLKTADAPDQAELIQEIRHWCKETEAEIKEQSKKAKSLQKAATDPDSLRPEELYNAALLVLGSDPTQAKELLSKAASMGLVAARKKLSTLK